MGKLMAIVQPLPKRVPFIGFSQYSHCPKSCHHRFNESIRASSSGRWCECKIAGFFDACRDKGLDGNQGVILPRANIAQLMLRDDIVQAVKDEQFHIYAIDHITDALALLSGMLIDDKNKHGEYKRNTLFGKIVKRLESWVQDDKDDKDNRTAKN